MSLNLLEPSGPVQACTGIALPLPSPYTKSTQTIMKFQNMLHIWFNLVLDYVLPYY